LGFGEGIAAGMRGVGGGAGVGADGLRAGAHDALATARQQAKTLIVGAFISRI
jgi:hypothetical protein